MKRNLVTVLLLLILASGLQAADSWPQFRGPAGTGIAQKADPVVKWNGTERIKWELGIRGKGWSSPVIWGDQLWVTTASVDGKQMWAICVNRQTGKKIHDILVFENERPRFCHPTNSYASCTPVIEEGRVYLHFGSYGTACVDTGTGKVLWTRRDLPCNHWRAPGSSPILAGNSLVVAYDGYDLQYVVAFDKQSGKTLWKQDRNIDYGTDNGDRKKAYSTARFIEHGGRKQVVSPSATDTVSYDPQSGKELWRVHHGGMNAAPVPQFGHGLVYIVGGSGPFSMVAVRPDGSGDITETHVEWNLGKSVPNRPSPLLIDDHLFMVNDAGIVTCLEAKTAQTVWQKRIKGEYRASPIYAAGRIYFSSMKGDVTVIAAGSEFKLLGESKLGPGFQASPAAVGKSLYLRSLTSLYCLE